MIDLAFFRWLAVAGTTGTMMVKIGVPPVPWFSNKVTDGWRMAGGFRMTRMYPKSQVRFV